MGYPIIDPLWNFDKDLLEQLSSWIMQGEEVVLMLDMNDHIYKSPFARKLVEIGFEELFRKTNSADAPHSPMLKDPNLSAQSTPLRELTVDIIFNFVMEQDREIIESTAWTSLFNRSLAPVPRPCQAARKEPSMFSASDS